MDLITYYSKGLCRDAQTELERLAKIERVRKDLKKEA